MEGHRKIGDRLGLVVELSVVIIAENEAENIGDALESVHWVDDVVVVDSGSSDRTIEIAKRYTERVTTRLWEGYGSQKNYATGLANYDWVLSIDADERVSKELAEEIQALMQSAPVSLEQPGTSVDGSALRTGILTASFACTTAG